MATIAVLGTLDTKGLEHAFVAEHLRSRGHQPLLIDAGALDTPQVPPDITRDEVAQAGGIDLAGLVSRRDRGESVAAMAKAAAAWILHAAQSGRIQGIISLGGGGGTSIATAAMRALPIGFPKVMVSTLASGNTAPFIGVKDIVLIPSVVDVSGLNRVSRTILTRAAGAICGMVESTPPPTSDRPVIAASMFGNTTACVTLAREALEKAGYEVLVFHATGTGGRTLESLVESGMVTGVLDLTTTEWADEQVGGILSAGSTRLEAAARRGIPAVISTGCLDMVNFGPPDTVPTRFRDTGRLFYQHNPQVTLMRTTVEENREIGQIIAAKLNQSTGPLTVMLPLQGGSVISAPGGVFHDPAADAALYQSLCGDLRPDIRVVRMDCTINDPAFAAASVAELTRLLN